MNVRKLTTPPKVAMIFLHIILGAVVFYYPMVFTVNLALVTSAAILYVLFYKNASELAPYFAMYLLGAEVFSRMSESLILYEYTKYAIVLIFALAWFLEVRPKKLCMPIVAYLLLMVPGIIIATQYGAIMDVKRSVSFNLSGPLCLTLSTIYFYKRPLSRQDVSGYAFTFILPIISMATYMLIFMPDISTSSFGTYSNFKFSGGFGPNQVSIVLGFGALLAFCTAVLLVSPKQRGLRWALLGLTSGIAAQSMMTFSRSGIYLTSAGALAAAVYLIRDARQRRILLASACPVLFLLGYCVLPRLDAFSGGRTAPIYALSASRVTPR